MGQIVGKFSEGGWMLLVTFSSLYILGHIILLSKGGERLDSMAHHLIHDVSRIEGTMADLLMWQTHMMQTYRHNLKVRFAAFRHEKLAKDKAEILPFPPYQIHYDSH